jgi:protein TonB
MGMWRSMIISFGVQTIAIAIVVIVSIFTVDKLGAISPPQLMPPLPRARGVMKIVASSHQAPASGAGVPVHGRFVAPAKIPLTIAAITRDPGMITEQAPSIGPGSGIGDGVIGALDAIGPAAGHVVAAPPPARKPDPPQTAKPIQIGGNVLEAKLVNRVMPLYTPLARQARISGTVRLEGIISKDGRVVNLQVISGHPLLVKAAVDAVRQWIYQPTLLNGQPVEVIAPIDVHFTLAQ